MARPAIDAAQYTQIIFVKSNWTGEIVNANHSDVTVGEIDTTHLQSTAKTNMPGDLQDPGSVNCDYHWNSDNTPPIGVVQLIIICNPPTGTYTGTLFTVTTSNTFVQPANHPGFEVYSGNVKSYNKKYPEDPAAMEGSMVIRLSGARTLWMAAATVAS